LRQAIIASAAAKGHATWISALREVELAAFGRSGLAGIFATTRLRFWLILLLVGLVIRVGLFAVFGHESMMP